MRPLWYSLRDTMRASCSKWDAGGYSTGWEKRSNSISRHGQSLLGFDTVRRRWQCIQRKCDKSRWTTEVNYNTCTLLYLLRYIFSKYPVEYLCSDITAMVGWALKKHTIISMSISEIPNPYNHTHPLKSPHIYNHTHPLKSPHIYNHTHPLKSPHIYNHIHSSHHTSTVTHIHSSHDTSTTHTSTQVTTHLQ